MAWPPSTLATNRTNSTPQTDSHPNDHNQVNAAVNDTVARVAAHESGAVHVNAAANADLATLAMKVRSVDTPNDIELHWDPPFLYFRIDGGEWNKITSAPIVGTLGGGSS